MSAKGDLTFFLKRIGSFDILGIKIGHLCNFLKEKMLTIKGKKIK